MKKQIEYIKLNDQMDHDELAVELNSTKKAVRISNILFFVVGVIVGIIIK